MSDDGFLSFVFVRCVEYLLRNDADPAVRDKQGYSAVHYASAYGRTLCLELVSTAAAQSEDMLHVLRRESENQKIMQMKSDLFHMLKCFRIVGKLQYTSSLVMVSQTVFVCVVFRWQVRRLLMW